MDTVWHSVTCCYYPDCPGNGCIAQYCSTDFCLENVWLLQMHNLPHSTAEVFTHQVTAAPVDRAVVVVGFASVKVLLPSENSFKHFDLNRILWWTGEKYERMSSNWQQLRRAGQLRLGRAGEKQNFYAGTQNKLISVMCWGHMGLSPVP